MPEFGPYTRWSDPRLFDLVSNLRSGGVAGWGTFQRALLLGHEPWFSPTWNTHRVRAAEKLLKHLTDSHLAVIVEGVEGTGIAATKRAMRKLRSESVSVQMAGDVASVAS